MTALKPFVAIMMGSDSDLPTMQATIEVLIQFKIAFEVKITSAHRTPQRTLEYVQDAEKRGCQVFICAAGLAAHLGGVVAAHTIKPVIGVPLDAALNGLDSLLSTVQMPGGIPVASVAIGKAGAQNAAYLSAQILALRDPELAARVKQQREDNAKKIASKDAQIQEKYALSES